MDTRLSDTGWLHPVLHLPPISPKSERAIRIRLARLEAEQAARAWAIEQHYQEARRLSEEMLADDQQRRKFRELLFMRGTLDET